MRYVIIISLPISEYNIVNFTIYNENEYFKLQNKLYDENHGVIYSYDIFNFIKCRYHINFTTKIFNKYKIIPFNEEGNHFVEYCFRSREYAQSFLDEIIYPNEIIKQLIFKNDLKKLWFVV